MLPNKIRWYPLHGPCEYDIIDILLWKGAPRIMDNRVIKSKKRSTFSIKRGYIEPDETRSFRNAVDKAILANQAKGCPIARYDAKTRKSYLEYPDGRREYAK